jgi:hypothetical protein
MRYAVNDRHRLTFGGTEVHLLEPVERRTLQKSIDLLPSQPGRIVRILPVAEVKRDQFKSRRR